MGDSWPTWRRSFAGRKGTEMGGKAPGKGEGSAGRAGEGIRADARVRVRLRGKGGVGLQVNSSVEPYYGKKIREDVLAGLEALGVEHARVELEDRGALPFVLLARLEAAVRRAWPECPGRIEPPGAVDPGPGTPRDRLRRSRLYLPADEPRFLVNPGLFGADGLILDLEDSVAPEAKDQARILARNALLCMDFGGAERMVRINQGEEGEKDLEEVVPARPDLLLLPKVEEGETVRQVERRIGEIQERVGQDRQIWLMPIVESAAGVLAAREIARASESVVALAVGLEDLTADLGAERTREGRETFTARSLVVLAARAAGVQPLDTVFRDVGDPDGLRRSVEEARALGFEGKGCIHPSQVKIVHQGFAPGPEAVQKALAIVRAYEEARRKGLGVVSLGTKMIDPPVVKRALRTVRLARELGLLEGEE